jgi:hypothetical protein
MRLRCLCGVATLGVENRRIVTRITASPTNYEENVKCKIVLQQIRPHFTAARFSLFADCDKRPSDPLSPVVLEGGRYEIHQGSCVRV